jgi:flagellar protein FliO/FliZ
LFCTAVLFGQERAGESEKSTPTAETELTFTNSDGGELPEGSLTTFSIWDFLRMIIILAAVVALIYVIFYFLKKAGAPAPGSMDAITILESKVVHGNKYVHLLEIGNSIFLVGTGDGGVRLIAEIKDKESADQIKLTASQNKNTGKKQNFNSFLSAFLPHKKGVKGDTVVDFIKQQRKRLKKL